MGLTTTAGCSRCAMRILDPMVCMVNGEESVMCLGCVADLRSQGTEVYITRSLIPPKDRRSRAR